jgi:putative FmdB family regulatory protein
MPLYQYSCDECEIVVEELHPIGRAPVFAECPICHGVCKQDIAPIAAMRPAPLQNAAPAPIYGRVPAHYHHDGCVCCTPRRR